jgi:cytoskeleton protein RodZ
MKDATVVAISGAAAGPSPPAPGGRLAAERERRGLGVQHVADALHVEGRLVEAMENDHFEAFDAPVYARGFLRKYATFLQLPPDELLAAYDALHGRPAAPTLIPLATAQLAARDWSRLKVPAAVVGVVLLVGAVYWWWPSRGRAPATLSAAPTAAAPTAAAPTEALRAASDPPAAAPNGAGPRASPAPPAAPASRTTPAASGGAHAPPGPRHRPAVAPARTAGAQDRALVIRGQRESWVEVYSPSGERLYSDLVHSGETRTLPGPGPWRVFLGQSDSVQLTVGGRTVVVPAARKTAATARFVVTGDGAVQ